MLLGLKVSISWLLSRGALSAKCHLQYVGVAGLRDFAVTRRTAQHHTTPKHASQCLDGWVAGAGRKGYDYCYFSLVNLSRLHSHRQCLRWDYESKLSQCLWP